MMNINDNDIESLGWKTNDPAAFQSLKSALIAFFETYQATYSEHSAIDLSNIDRRAKFEISKYKSSYFTAITHFQHFFEYILKATLEKINPIFAEKYDERGFSDIYALVQGLPLSEMSSQSIEFSDALKRLKKIKTIDVGNPIINEIDFLLQNEKTLNVLTNLRNRIWHKSLFFLQYHNLDLFIGQNILPLVKQTMALSEYASNETWRYKRLNCGKDPIDEIIAECTKATPSYEKIALLKELGRAAYCNPLSVISATASPLEKCLVEYGNSEKKAEHIAKADAVCKEFFFTDVFDCPVCGQHTLIKHEMIDGFETTDALGNTIEATCYIPEKIKCEACSFEVRENIKDLSCCGIASSAFWDRHL
ncbi:hypothetical protein [Fibrobacter sp.]